MSLLLETLEVREIQGWVYQRLVPLGGKDRKPPPTWLWPLLVRAAPSLRSRVQAYARAMRADKPWAWIERQRDEWNPRLIERLAGLRPSTLAAIA